MKTIILKTEKDTQKLARSIAKSLKGGEIIALSGELGAGKTTFTQYLAEALGVKEHVNSPTFVIMRIYKTSKRPLHDFVHVDAYRLDNDSDLETIGLDQYIGQPHAVVVVEWAERLPHLIKDHDKMIRLDFIIKGSQRVIKIINK